MLRSTKDLLIIKAKNDDLARGFTQLSAQLIALSQVDEQEIYYGAVTLGNVWQFGRLDNSQKVIVQDINLFKFPDDLENLARVIVGILEGAQG